MLGFRATADLDTVQYGPQPYEGVIAEICAAFGCPPDVAERQDWALVQAIFDYRNAQAARDLFNRGRKGMDELMRQPQLQAILLAMHRAQQGDQVEMGHVLGAMAAKAAPEDEDG